MDEPLTKLQLLANVVVVVGVEMPCCGGITPSISTAPTIINSSLRGLAQGPPEGFIELHRVQLLQHFELGTHTEHHIHTHSGVD